MHHPPSFSPPRRRLLQGALAASVVPAWVRPARAAAPWPQKPVRLVVGFPPGSSPDALARTVADPLAQMMLTGKGETRWHATMHESSWAPGTC